MVSFDWAERRYAPSFTPTDPPDLTAVRLQACAADNNIMMHRRGVELTTLGATRTPTPTIPVPFVRSAWVGEVSESARLVPAARGGVPVSCRRLPRTSVCGHSWPWKLAWVGAWTVSDHPRCGGLWLSPLDALCYLACSCIRKNVTF